jgi:uncharacterized membrane protein YbhN (UPF0104 family)
VKYIPGYGWQLVGKSYMTTKIGYASNTVIASMLFEFMVILFSGLFIAALFIPPNFDLQLPIFTIIIRNRHFLQVLALVILVGCPHFFQLISSRIPKNKTMPRIDLRWVMVLVVLLGFTWIVNSVGFSFLFTAVGIQTPISLPYTVFVFTSTFIIGLIVIIAPGSIGVRESLFIFFLTPVIGGSVAGVIAIVYRIITIFAEVLMATSNFFYMKIINKE